MIEKPEMIFPCTCMSEGIVVIKSYADDDCIDMAFFQYGQVNIKWSWKMRWHFIWHLIRTGRAYTDMVSLSPKVAKHLAHHILYLLDKKKEQDQTKLLVKDVLSASDAFNKATSDLQSRLDDIDPLVIPGFNTSALDLRSEEAFEITKNVKESASETIQRVREGNTDIP